MSAYLPYFNLLLESVDRDPAEILDALDGHFHFGYWDSPSTAVSEGGDLIRAVERLCEELCSAARVADGQKILDVGCGLGGTLGWLDQRFENLDLTGLNIDGRQLKWARRRLGDGRRTDAGANRIELVEADACDLPFEDDSFDRVLAVECIFHFSSRERFFREAHRVLRPGGRLVLSDFLPVPLLAPWMDPGARLFRTVLGHLDFSYTLRDYRRLARQIPLRVTREQDITVNTMPSYRLFVQVMCRLNRSLFERWLIRSGFGLTGWYSRQGMLRYMILAFLSDDPQAGIFPQNGSAIRSR